MASVAPVAGELANKCPGPVTLWRDNTCTTTPGQVTQPQTHVGSSAPSYKGIVRTLGIVMDSTISTGAERADNSKLMESIQVLERRGETRENLRKVGERKV
jgi:hypothetical protein